MIFGAAYAATVMLRVVLAVRPLLSVTVMVTVDVPLLARMPDVKLDAVKFAPWKNGD